MDENISVEAAKDDPIVERVADIVAAYVAHNPVPPAEIGKLIAATHAALVGLAQPASAAEPETAKLTPAQIRKSIAPNGLVSFIDGKSYKTLKRHLTKHGLTPDTYRARYGLPTDYPTTAASYSEARAVLARASGLGSARRKIGSEAEASAAGTPMAEATAEPATKPARGRKPKAATAG